MASRCKISYHQRLFLLLLAFSWTMLLCFAVFQYYREREVKSSLLNRELQLYNRQLLGALEEAGEGWPEAERVARLKAEARDFWQEAEGLEVRVTVVDLEGRVLYDDRVALDSLGNHADRPEIAGAMAKGTGYHISRNSASDGHRYFYSATRGQRFVVRSAIPYTASLRELLKADWAFLWAIFFFSIGMSVVAYFATRRIGRTIERLNAFAARAERGESLDEREAFPSDELGSISEHIVRLYARKRQLTNNINHELKTPVSSIQVCLETLLSGMELGEEKRQELLGRCYDSTIRLRQLLTDVSLITRMEEGSQSIERERIVVNDILTEIADELQALPEEEGMALHLDIGEAIVVNGNQGLLNSIFRNLTENALAYSGGRNIYVSLLSHEGGLYALRFEDDGCGVEEEKLPRLFERFYRVDKGRSRQRGGTGLGLSIVKHAVLFHGGTISVTNRPGGGLRFDFTLHE